MKAKIFVTALGQLIDVEGNFTTWGELQAELANKGVSTSSVKAIVKETQMAFESDSAALPVGIGKDIHGNPNGTDFTLFLNPIQTKSGQ